MSNTFSCILLSAPGELPQGLGVVTRMEGAGAPRGGLDALGRGIFTLVKGAFPLDWGSLARHAVKRPPDRGGFDRAQGQAALKALLLYFYLVFACILCVRPTNWRHGKPSTQTE